jgi:G:T-mismatch repair DNA endonuclease (very short patch repair protein)
MATKNKRITLMTKLTQKDAQKEIDMVRQFLKENGFDIQVTWLDEYGGKQSVIINEFDNLGAVERKKSNEYT